MAFIVEDGTIVEDANSYVTEAEFDYYCDSLGKDPDDGDVEQALVRGTQAIDARYRARYPGTRAEGRDQSLEWPRTEATDINGFDIDEDEIPQEVKDAVCEAALRELTEPGSMLPDLERGGNIKRLKAGSVEVEYGAGATATTKYTAIDGILSSLIGSASQYTARAARG